VSGKIEGPGREICREAEAIFGEQLVAILKQAEVGVPVANLVRQAEISEQTFYRWKKQYVGLEVDQVRQLRRVQEEDVRLKRLVAELALDKTMLQGVRLFVSDKCLGLVESLGEFYPEAMWQRCAVHFYGNVWTAVPTSKVKAVAAMLKVIHAQEDRAAARQKAEQVVAKLKEMKLTDAAALLSAGIEETLYYYAFPRELWEDPEDRLIYGPSQHHPANGSPPS
jgi:hypothetical protein